eukprot:5535486-Pleurochrysis_carterae.AAC.1
MRVVADRAQQHPQRGLADEGHRTHRRHGSLGAEAGEDCIAQQLLAGLAKVGLLLEIARCAGCQSARRARSLQNRLRRRSRASRRSPAWP